MTHYRKLVGEHCFLSPLQIEDAGCFTRWMNDLEVTLPLGDEAYIPYSDDKMREEIADAIRKSEHVFAIVDCASEKLLGRCLLFSIDPLNRSAMLGIFIGEKESWGKGYGQEATRLLVDYGFNLLNLHSILLGVFSFNERAAQAYRKTGFQDIGRRREARIIGGKAYDVLLMDILEDEFRARWPSVLYPTFQRSGITS